MAQETNQGSFGNALAKAAEYRDKAAGYMLLAPGEANRIIGGLSGRTLAWWAIALGAVLLLSVNIIFSNLFRGASADLTEKSLYTISKSTKRVLGKLEEPINVRVYYSSRLGEASSLYKRYFERVRALLERYSTMAGGKLNIAFIDPVPFSDAEDRAVSAGLQGVQLNAEGDKGYFGLVATNSTDNTETISFFTPQRETFLEYDITKLIHKLAAPKKMVVGLITSLQINGGFDMRRRQPVQPWQIMTQIAEFFEVRALAQNLKEVPKDVDVLMLVQPNNLTAEAAYAIDQFALKGGRVLAFIDPVPDVARLTTPTAGGGTINPEMAKLLKAWGVSFDAKRAAGDIDSARRVQMGGPQPVITEYVAWLALREKSHIDGSDVISDGVKLLNLVTPGYFAPIEKAKTKFQPVLFTSKRAMSIDTAKLTGPQPDPIGLLQDYKEGGKSLVVAARVTGDVATAFPDGPPKAKPDPKDKSKPKPGTKPDPKEKAEKDKTKKPEAAAPKALKAGKLNAIIIGDTDMLYDQFWMESRQMFGQQVAIPIAHNAVFVINALENLSGGEALAGLRGRGVDERPFETVNRIRRAAEKEFRDREKALRAKLDKLRAQLSQVEKRSGSGGIILSDEDKKAIEKFKLELLDTRKKLRDVKLAMRADIDSLESRLQFINIAAVPLLIGLGAFAFAAFRRRRRQAN
ncbi:MAG: Gldg family protein [Hyphomicrobiaceae bacterium]|nr:Gldg family protein [Hyphomicrobiaceae bacterium]